MMGGFAIAGPAGVVAWGENRRVLDRREAQLAALEAEWEALKKRVALLNTDQAGADIDGEMLRSKLNGVHAYGVVIKLED